MKIPNIFKKKKIKETKTERPAETKKPKIKEVKKEIGVVDVYKILREPYISEKTTDLAKKNQYIFKVFPEVNKTEIKKAIGDLYGVEVLSVKIINIPRKQRMVGRIRGWRKGYKKAIVKIKEGQKIEVLPR